MAIEAKIPLGIIGGGRQAEEHLLALQNHPTAFLGGIQEIDPRRREELKEKYGADSLLEENETWEDRKVQGLILCLPHHVYEKEWGKILSYKLPLLKEKPLGRSAEEALQFLDQCHIQQVPLQTAIQRRNHPSYLFLKKVLIGENIKGIRAVMHLGFKRPTEPQKDWRADITTAGGGALLDSGYHLVDLVLFLVGPFRLLSSQLVTDGRLWQRDLIDDEARLFGLHRSTWIDIESKTYTLAKKESVEVQTQNYLYRANREGVWKNDKQIFSCQREWHEAMKTQLMVFSENVALKRFESPEIRDQFPALRIISQAYHRNGGVLY